MKTFLALRGALPDYAQVTVTLAYYSGMRMGEVSSLQWNQVNWREGKLYLRAQDTKTDTPRVLYLTGDLLRVLTVWKQRCDQKWPQCSWICHRGGVRLESLKHSWRKGCEAVGLGRMTEVEGTEEKVWIGKIPHDFRRLPFGTWFEQVCRRRWPWRSVVTKLDQSSTAITS